MKHSVFCTSVLSLLLLNAACGRQQIRINTSTLEREIRGAYESCLRDEGAFEFTTQKEFIARLEGKNTLGISYLGVPPYMRNQDGQVIDEWGQPLRITRPEKNKLEIRSASEDGIFGTADDIVTVYPPVPGSRKSRRFTIITELTK